MGGEGDRKGGSKEGKEEVYVFLNKRDKKIVESK